MILYSKKFNKFYEAGEMEKSQIIGIMRYVSKLQKEQRMEEKRQEILDNQYTRICPKCHMRTSWTGKCENCDE